MQLRAILSLAALVSASFSVGCSMTNPTVRGQNLDNQGPVMGSAPGYGEIRRYPYLGRYGNHDFTGSAVRNNNFGYEGGYYAGQNGYYTETSPAYAAMAQGAGCQQCNNGQSCPQGGCRRCGRGCYDHNGLPRHYQTYQYNWPQNMVYPQQGVPSGVIQYPYYTLRGPTDFFMEKSL